MIGDLVAFDCYQQSPLASLGRVMGFEERLGTMWILIGAGRPVQVYKRMALDLDAGLIRKLIGGIPE